ncbi:gluconokinase [Serinibacter salmoneus]|uniref:Gluconate kinase (FGGY family) n=1 Tax=Serinibacter salmoneus TaxID=556530 RepID=A0A2A9CW95_9MICO|nr:gluconokinase [Serinibacter salmoneus]PFG18673.1 gluconate kinase (FGGY family) [Serinibacter salmoneus]
MTQVVLGVDIGTTATKVVAFTPQGDLVASAEAGYPLHTPHPGYAEQDPEQILAAVIEASSAVVQQVGAERVAALSFSSAMHTLIGLSPAMEPLTPSSSWADTRADAQAERIRASTGGLGLHRRTGTPVHPMSPMVRLAWFHEQEPKLCERVGFWCGIKEYVLLRLTGALVMDRSIASCSGLLNLESLTWDSEALAVAGVLPEQLPELVATTHALPLADDGAAHLGLPAGTPVVVGAGDGPLANLGVGAVRPGMAACSLGTSGALRVMVDRPVVDPLGRVFCYALTDDLWVVGGAINNGGIVMRWALEALAPDLAGEEDLLELAASAPAGSGGLLMMPYLLSERAPRWSSLPQGAYVGLTRAHGREHLVRAALEGVCLQLSLVLESMRAAGLEVGEVRATGGVMRSDLWRQMLADALGTPIDLTEGEQGSGYGAAVLGMVALGLMDSVADAAASATVTETVRPDAAAAGVYGELRPVYSGLYDALAPAFGSLKRLAPALPLR